MEIISEGTPDLAFELIDNGTAYSVKRGTVNSSDILIPSFYQGLPVISIGKNAFAMITKFISVIIPEGVTSIGYGAFHFCISLESITIPESVTFIGKHVFTGCLSLTGINVQFRKR